MSSLAVGLVCAVLGLLVPLMVRRIPEPVESTDPVETADAAEKSLPEPVEASVAHDEAAADVVATTEAIAASGPTSPPSTEADDSVIATAPEKELYTAIADHRGVAVASVLASGLAGAVLGWALGWAWSLLFLVPLVPVLVGLAIIDWRTKLLPTWVIARTYAALVPLVLVVGAVTGEWDDVLRAFWGWLITGGLYFVLWFINSAGLGYGDVRLSGIIGIVLGQLGWGTLFAGVYSAFILGGVIGGVLALAKLVDRRGVPFGPFMVAGALMGVVLGPWTAANLG
ncbi:prepilin peptidase [Nocardioides jishulii]|uniref:Prepilin peptidase n=1 Tax=Nocardioides jishulii TaxID=2575440 RepID=A0A4U2YLZ8_9ACTN|nr:A24 family peptidase [Nocardioides jishulii]QCX27449.1 prepilin peptidase [Nocardioides jishulii]TKI62256.1 prepilin peptidase [Nocardioides jishulii]